MWQCAKCETRNNSDLPDTPCIICKTTYETSKRMWNIRKQAMIPPKPLKNPNTATIKINTVETHKAPIDHTGYTRTISMPVPPVPPPPPPEPEEKQRLSKLEFALLIVLVVIVLAILGIISYYLLKNSSMDLSNSTAASSSELVPFDRNYDMIGGECIDL